MPKTQEDQSHIMRLGSTNDDDGDDDDDDDDDDDGDDDNDDDDHLPLPSEVPMFTKFLDTA